MRRVRRQPGPSTASPSSPSGAFQGFHKGGPEDPLLGSELDRGLVITSKIGIGGTSNVYLARGPSGEKAAVKVASTRLDPDLMNRLIEHEALMLRRLSHPNIIRCDGEGTVGGRRYAILEHLEGSPLSASLDRRRRLGWPHVKSLMIQICDALEAVHGKGIIHRDVKARNIFLTDAPAGEVVKLLDFGLALDLGKPDPIPKGTPTGTASHMAPELILGGCFDFRADIYSSGVLMYSLLCGTLPFTGGSAEVLRSHVFEAPIEPRALHPYLEMPYDIQDIVMRALSKRPIDRFGSAAEMREAIESASRWHRDMALIDGLSWARVIRLDGSGTDDD